MKCPVCGASVDERFEPFRLIDWANGEDFITIETSVGHLSEDRRAAFLAALNVFVEALNKEAAR